MRVDCKEELAAKLARFGPSDIIFTDHCQLRAAVRQISLEEVKSNLLGPRRLAYASRQPSRPGEAKYDCYFRYSKSLAHRYVIVINNKLVVITAIKVRKRWQRRLERHAKK